MKRIAFKKLLTIDRWRFVTGVFVYYNHQTIEYLGTEHWIGIIVPQRLKEGYMLKTLAWRKRVPDEHWHPEV